MSAIFSRFQGVKINFARGLRQSFCYLISKGGTSDNHRCPTEYNMTLNKMSAIFQTTFSNTFFFLVKMYEFWLRFHWSLFLRVQLTIFLHWFRLWLGAVQATSHDLNQWWPNLLTHMCVTKVQCVERCHPILLTQILIIICKDSYYMCLSYQIILSI